LWLIGRRWARTEFKILAQRSKVITNIAVRMFDDQ
jgi:hypothetical protein